MAKKGSNEYFTKLENGLWQDNKTGKIGPLKPNGHGGFYVGDEEESKKEETSTTKSDYELARPNTTKLDNMIEEGLVDELDVDEMALKYADVDSIKDAMRVLGYDMEKYTDIDSIYNDVDLDDYDMQKIGSEVLVGMSDDDVGDMMRLNGLDYEVEEPSEDYESEYIKRVSDAKTEKDLEDADKYYEEKNDKSINQERIERAVQMYADGDMDFRDLSDSYFNGNDDLATEALANGDNAKEDLVERTANEINKMWEEKEWKNADTYDFNNELERRVGETLTGADIDNAWERAREIDYENEDNDYDKNTDETDWLAEQEADATERLERRYGQGPDKVLDDDKDNNQHSTEYEKFAKNIGDKVQTEDVYTGKYSGEYEIVREATREEKAGLINTDMPAYFIKDEQGNERLVSGMRMKPITDKGIENTEKIYKSASRVEIPNAEKLNGTEKQILIDYTDDMAGATSGHQINKWLSGKYGEERKQIAERQANKINALIKDPLPNNTRVYSQIPKEYVEGVAESGDIANIPEFLSTSMFDNSDFNYGDNMVNTVIDVDKGTKAISLVDISRHPEEAEILFSNNQTLVLREIKDGKYYFVLKKQEK